ncbi:hypothetical protein EDD18DRAFT_1157644 [Armillaria luteobubalina]|uniref:FHA domain-containing protein n=1 Tax=Armillaria luteobubalina TaxID=153913 RepID=A0AA39QA93_9AGAR|nr:hypothetical protein EDD18DRAFT_1157644 [Armillaria luteobubalina]
MEDVGRFGTVSLLDASTGNAITAFGIDTSPVTFGSDPSCTVRLFYPSISASHAHITFHDLKAFLVVSGPSGIEVDGCKVYPPSTIPLPNRTEFKLAGKRFMFSYPPKEMRRVLIESPIKPRAIRMSMVARAVIDSPQPPRGLIKDLGGGECVLLEDIPRPPSPSKGPPSLHKRVLMKNAKQAEDEMEELEVVGGLVAVSDSESELSISEGGDQSESDEEVVPQSEPMENVPSSEAEPMDVDMKDEDEDVIPTTPKFVPPTARFSFSSRPSLGGGPPQKCRIRRPTLNFAPPATPQTNTIKKDPAWTTPKRKVVLTAEEKKAISERRRSALVAPDLFFAGRVPGLSPPKKASDNNPFASPTKYGQRSTLLGVGEEVEEDSRVLLAKMRDAVEDLKMRRAVKAEEVERKVDMRVLRNQTIEAIDVDAEDSTIPKTPVQAASPAKSLLTTPQAASPSKPALVTPRATSPAKSLWPRAASPTKVVVTPRVYSELTSLVPTSPMKIIPQSPAKTIPKSRSQVTIEPGSPIKGTFNTPIRAAYPLKRTLSTPLVPKTPKAAPSAEVKSPLKITWPYRNAEDHEKEQAMEKVEHIIAPVISLVEEVTPSDARGDEPMEEETTADRDVVSDADEVHDEQLESVDECVTPSPKKRTVKVPTPPPQSDTEPEPEQEQEQELDGPTPKRTVRGKRVRTPSRDADVEMEEVAPPKKATRGKRAATPTTEARPTRTRARTRTKTEPDDDKEKAKLTRPRTRAKTEEPEDEVPKKTRGRAKKAAAEVETEEEERVEVAPKKGRGRPKKVVEETTEDDETAAPLKRTTRGRKTTPAIEDKPATRGKKPSSTVSGSTSDVEIVGETKPARKVRKKVDKQEKENPPLAGVKEEEEDAGLGKGARTRTRSRARTRT